MKGSKMWVLYLLTAALVLFVAVVLGLTVMEKRKGELQKSAAAASAATPAPSPAPTAEEAPTTPEAAAPAVPVAPVAPATLNKLFTEAEKAFAAKDYKLVVEKLTELLKLCGNKPDFPIEMLSFNLGLAHLLDGNSADAEKAFAACVEKFPKGEYASRCHLGIGKAALAQGGDAKRKVAIEAFTKATADPKFRTEAGRELGQIYIDDNKPEEALKVFRALMGSDVRTQQQTAAAVEVIGLLAATDQINELVTYLDRVISQPGVRDAIAWYSNQAVVKADAMAEKKKWEAALAIYRSLPSREQILADQNAALASQKQELEKLKLRQEEEAKAPDALAKRAKVGELVSQAESALKLNEEAKAAIEGMKEFDAALLMRCGRCAYYLERREEALASFAAIREKHPQATDAEAAAFAEITLYNELKDQAKFQELRDAFKGKYPNSPKLKEVEAMELAAGK